MQRSMNLQSRTLRKKSGLGGKPKPVVLIVFLPRALYPIGAVTRCQERIEYVVPVVGKNGGGLLAMRTS